MERYWADVSFLAKDQDYLTTGIDVLLAGLVFRSYTAFSDLWRFHRRFAKDQTGHRFTFYMHTFEDMIQALYEEIQKDPLVEFLTKNGYGKIKTDYLSENYHRAWDTGSLSDPSWHPVVRNNWPWLATGFSRMWLEMILVCMDRLRIEIPKKLNRTNVENLIQACSMINGMIVGIYQTQGQHFVTHHTDVLFGTWDKGK